MSRKGAFVYQQIEMTTGEWAVNNTVYPVSVWLFERLENGKFNMKLADGVHTFAELPAVMQDVTVTEKTNTDLEYVLEIETAAGVITTPNLRGKNGEKYDDTAIKASLSALQQQVDTLVSGNASSAIDTFNEIVSFLANVEDSETLQGIIAGLNQSIANVQRSIPGKLSELQNDDHTVKDTSYVHTDNNYTDEEKDMLWFLSGSNSITTLSGIPVTKRTVNATLSTATPFSLAGDLPEGRELLIRCVPSATFTQPLPNSGVYTLMSDESIAATANKPFEVSVWCHKAGYYSIVVKEQEV